VPSEYDTSMVRSSETAMVGTGWLVVDVVDAILGAGWLVIDLVDESLVQAANDQALTSNNGLSRWFVTRADCPLRRGNARSQPSAEPRVPIGSYAPVNS